MTAGISLLLVVLALVAALSIRPFRENMLKRLLSRADASLPGSIHIGEAKWPAAGKVVLKNLVWTDEGDTLTAAAHLGIEFRLLPLLRRDIQVEEISIEVTWLDVPAIRERFPGESDSRQVKSDRPGRPFFPRSGSLPGLPSLAVGRFDLKARRINTGAPPAGTSQPAAERSGAGGGSPPPANPAISAVELAGSVDMSRGRPASLHLEHLSAVEAATGIRIDQAWADIDLSAGTLQGQGRGAVSPDWPFYFALSSNGDGHFSLRLAETDRASPPEAVGIVAEGSYDYQHTGLHWLKFRAQARTPGSQDLAKISALKGVLGRFNSLDGILAELRGGLVFQPAMTARATVELRPNNWLNSGNAVITYQNRGLDIDSLSLRLTDLAIEGTAAARPDSLAAVITTEVRGVRWLRQLMPDIKEPDSLRAEGRLAVSGLRSSPQISVRASASGRTGGFEFDRLTIEAGLPGDRNQPGALSIEVESRGMAVSTQAEIGRGTEPRIRLAPLVVNDLSRPPVSGRDPIKSGLIHYKPAQQTLIVDKVRITGAVGDISLSGKLEGTTEASYQVACRWPSPPGILTRILNLPSGQADSLRVRWLRADPFGLRFTGRMSSATNAPKHEISGTFALPGPAVLSALLAGPNRFQDLESLNGGFSLAAESLPGGFRYGLDLDLNPTAWIDTAAVKLSGQGASLAIDTVGITFEDVTLELTGGMKEKSVDLQSRLNVKTAKLLNRFSSRKDDLEASLRAAVDVTGQLESPVIEASLTAQAAGPSYRIPELSASLVWADSSLGAVIELAQGMSAPPLILSHLKVSYRAESTPRLLLPGVLRVDGSGREMEFHHGITIDQTEGKWVLSGDLFDLRLHGRDLSSTSPFRISYDPSTSILNIDNFQLSGGLGSIKAGGYSGPDSANLQLTADVTLPEMPASLSLPAELWPERVAVNVNAGSFNRFQGGLSVFGVTFPGRRKPDIRLDLSNREGSLLARMSVVDESDSLMTGRLTLPASLSLFPPGAELKDGPLKLDLRLNNVPIPAEKRSDYLSGSRTALCNADVYARGTTANPSVFADANFTFPGWPKLSEYRLELDLQIPSSPHDEAGRAGHQIPAAGGEDARPDSTSAEGLSVRLVTKRENRQLINAGCFLPVTLSALPFQLDVHTSRESRFQTEATELDLSEFDALLPPHVGMKGWSSIRFDANGPLKNPHLSSTLSFRKFQLSLEDGSRIAAFGSLQLAGTALRPSLTGAIEIQNGILRIPDPPKDLHAARGPAILWEYPVTDSLGGPIVPGEPLLTGPAGTGAEVKDRVEADIDVTVRIPSGLWIRGQGVNVEMAGELHLVQKTVYPTVAGELHAVRGNMIFIGRNFNMEKGSVSFFGEDKIEPVLDISLSTKVEGVLIRITIRGTVSKPELSITSEPEMAEGDIISFLLFGKPIDDLDHDQSNLLQRRAGELATSFGLAQLEARVARQLGVDMVSIQKSKRDDNQKSLVIGKYLSRRALLKYEQMLEDQANFFVNLEYFLTNNFKIETIIGRQYQSGIEADWTKDY